MSIKLLTEHHLEFLSLKGDCTGSSESTLDKMPLCWEPHVMAHFIYFQVPKPPTIATTRTIPLLTVVIMDVAGPAALERAAITSTSILI